MRNALFACTCLARVASPLAKVLERTLNEGVTPGRHDDDDP
jgi:hypothetical protein